MLEVPKVGISSEDGQSEQVDKSLGNAGAKAEPALIAVIYNDWSAAEIRDPLGPQERMTSLVGEVRGHLELGFTALQTAEKVEKQTRPAKFGVAIKAENYDLLLGR